MSVNVSVAPGSPARNRISRATLTEQLEQALRADILDGVLAPGQRLRASDLTERYGVSATPLREALQRLAVENLVELDPRYGATVASISASDLRDIYEQLQLIGCLALERSIARGDDAWAAAVADRFEALSVAMHRLEQGRDADDDTRRRLAAEAGEAHWDFHNALYSACDSPWLMRFVQMLHAHSERYRRLAQHAGGTRRDTLHEHQEIMDAAERRDASAGVTALREHLGATVRLLEDTFGEGARARA
jgi:GntR family transcriptional regulator, carbon starvation induced regulator